MATIIIKHQNTLAHTITNGNSSRAVIHIQILNQANNKHVSILNLKTIQNQMIIYCKRLPFNPGIKSALITTENSGELGDLRKGVVAVGS